MRDVSVIKVFCGVFVFSRCFLDFSVDIGVFVIGLSQISSFLSLNIEYFQDMVHAIIVFFVTKVSKYSHLGVST